MYDSQLLVKQRAFAVALTAVLAGCAGRSAQIEMSPQERETTLPPGVDRTRALKPLSEIEPRVERPVRPADLKPLSDRGTQQIAAARSLIDQQRYTEAALELERALRYDPNHPDIHRTLALLQWQAGNVERAKAHAQKAIQSNPDDAGAHYVLGRCATAAGDLTAAIQEYRTALICSDLHRDVEIAGLTHYHLAEALVKEHYLGAALAEYVAFESKAQGVRGEACEAKSGILEQLGRLSEAADALAPAVASGPADGNRALRYARLLHQSGRSAEALNVLRTAPADSEDAFGLLLEIYEAAGTPEDAVKDLRTRLMARPDDARLVVKLADILVRLRRGEEARTELQTFLATHADVQIVRARLLDLLAAESAWADFLASCAAGIQAQPSRADEYEARIRSMVNDAGAVAALLDAPRQGEQSAASLYLRGILAEAANRPRQAEEFLKAAFTTDAALLPARAALARLYLRAYRYDEALSVAARRDEASPEDARLELVQGQVYERLDDADKAALHFKAAFQLNPGDAQAMLELARLQRRSDDPLTAQRQLRVLLERHPANEDARETLAMMYLQEGKLDAATEQLEELKRRAVSPAVKARTQALSNLVRDRDTEAYRKALRAAMDTNGTDAATWLALAESYNEFEQAPAREAYLNAVAMDPDNEAAALGLIFADQRLMQYESASERFNKLLPRRPHRHAWRLGWGGSSWQVGMIELHLVLQDYDAALELTRSQAGRDDLETPTRTRYRLAWLECLRASGKKEELIRQLQSWSDGDTDESRRWRQALAEEYKRQDQIALALPILETAYRAEPNDKDALREYLDALASAKQHDRAAQYILDWLSEDPENDDALAALVAVLAQQQRVTDAQELVRNKLLHTRDRERFQDVQLLLLDSAKQHAEAADLLESLIGGVVSALRSLREPPGRRGGPALSTERTDRLPNEPFSVPQLQQRLDRLQGRLAMQLIEAKDFREADRRLREWLEEARSPDVRFAYVMALASCQREQGDEAQAQETVELALALKPDHIGLNNDAAYGWIDRGMKLEEAERMIRFAISRDPRHMAYLDTFGWLMYKKGEFAEARKWLERAVNADLKKDAVVLDHLGDVCWRSGDHEAALRRWEEAKEFIQDRPAEEKLNADERRVRSTIQQKIDDGRAGRQPAVAALRVQESEPKSDRSEPHP